MISITPDGLINIISEGYGRCTPDSKIFEVGGFLEKLTQRSILITDMGFKHISLLLEQHGCTLLKPPSVSSNSKPRGEIDSTARLIIPCNNISPKLTLLCYLVPKYHSPTIWGYIWNDQVWQFRSKTAVLSIRHRREFLNIENDDLFILICFWL